MIANWMKRNDYKCRFVKERGDLEKEYAKGLRKLTNVDILFAAGDTDKLPKVL